MAKKKNIKPLFNLKHDFIDSLDEFISQSMMLATAVNTALDLKQVSEKAAPILQERYDAWIAATMTRDEP